MHIEMPYDNLIFTDRNRFQSGHEAARRLRSLYAKAVLADRPDMMGAVLKLISEKRELLYPVCSDICELQQLADSAQFTPGSLAKESVPFFRPVHPSWDVMLTALLMQKTISESEIDKIIAGFKSMLPKSSKGVLPDLDTPYDVHYVSLATGTRVDFVPSSFELVTTI